MWLQLHAPLSLPLQLPFLLKPSSSTPTPPLLLLHPMPQLTAFPPPFPLCPMTFCCGLRRTNRRRCSGAGRPKLCSKGVGGRRPSQHHKLTLCLSNPLFSCSKRLHQPMQVKHGSLPKGIGVCWVLLLTMRMINVANECGWMRVC